MKHIILLSQTSRNNCSGKSVISFTVSSFYLKEREKTKTATQVDKTFDFFIFIKVWALPPLPRFLRKAWVLHLQKPVEEGSPKGGAGWGGGYQEGKDETEMKGNRCLST